MWKVFRVFILVKMYSLTPLSSARFYGKYTTKQKNSVTFSPRTQWWFRFHCMGLLHWAVYWDQIKYVQLETPPNKVSKTEMSCHFLCFQYFSVCCLCACSNKDAFGTSQHTINLLETTLFVLVFFYSHLRTLIRIFVHRVVIRGIWLMMFFFLLRNS